VTIVTSSCRGSAATSTPGYRGSSGSPATRS
jgi:hypothetical protein